MKRALIVGSALGAGVVVLVPSARGAPGDEPGTSLLDDLAAPEAEGDADEPAPPPLGPGEPRAIWVWYADGGPPPSASLCPSTPPPKFNCLWGTPDDCQRQ